MMRWLKACALVACLFLSTPGWAEVAVPPLNARVTDLTGTLTTDQQAALEETLQAFERKKGSQIAVLLVPTTEPETIEQYSIRVAEKWKLGRKGVDDGALLLIAKDDRTLRIESGYGLEGVLSDIVSKRIISDDIVPHLKNGNFYQGISAGIDRMIRVVDGEPLPPPSSASQQGWDGNMDDLLPGAILAGLVAGKLLRLFLGALFGALATFGLVTVVAWLAFQAWIPAFFAGLFATVFSFTNIGLGGGYRGGGGGFGGGGFGGGGGFSGGGGGFGGGGASGRF